MKKRVLITLIIWITVFQTHVWCVSNKHVLVIGNSDYEEVPRKSISLQEDVYYFSIEVKEQVNPLDYYPLHVGNTWLYHHVYKTVIGQSAKFITITWESEESVIAHYDLPEGKVIIRRIMNQDIEYDYPEDIEEETLQGFLEIEKIEEEYNRYYLVKGNYIYELSNRYWDDDKKTVTEEFRKRTKEDFGTPLFFFPMEKVHVWSNRAQEQEDYMKGELWKQGKGPAPNPVMYYWHVENPVDVEVPFGIVKQAIPLIYRQLCGPERVWFKKEIGIIKERFDHQGTYIEREKVLKDFFLHKNNE